MKKFLRSFVSFFSKIRVKLFSHYPSNFMRFSFDALFNCGVILQSGYRAEKRDKQRKAKLETGDIRQLDMSLFSNQPFDLLLFVLLLSKQCDEAIKNEALSVTVYIDSQVIKKNFQDLTIFTLLMPIAVDCISSLPTTFNKKSEFAELEKQDFKLKSKIIPQFDCNSAREFFKKQGLDNIYVGVNFPENYVHDRKKLIEFLEVIIEIKSELRIVVFNNFSQDLAVNIAEKFHQIIQVRQLGLNKIDLLGLVTEIDVFVGQYDIYSLIAQTYEVPCLVYGKRPNYLTDVVGAGYVVESFNPNSVSQFLKVAALNVN